MSKILVQSYLLLDLRTIKYWLLSKFDIKINLSAISLLDYCISDKLDHFWDINCLCNGHAKRTQNGMTKELKLRKFTPSINSLDKLIDSYPPK